MSIHLALSVPCRKCENCVKRRTFMWRQRCLYEIAKANRTWFGTLTLSPQSHFEDLTHARISGERRSVDFDLSNDDEKYRALAKIFHGRVQRMMKRVRKNTGANIRYIAVYERHRSGYAHCHLFVHERTPSDMVSKRILDREWHGGFPHWRLVKQDDKRAPYYITKYISKDAALRIRNSLHYGEGIDTEETQLAHILENVKNVKTGEEKTSREGYDPPSALASAKPTPLGNRTGSGVEVSPARLGDESQKSESEQASYASG